MKSMKRSTVSIIVSAFVIIFIFLILISAIKSYDSSKESSDALRIAMAVSVIFMSALANVLSDRYIRFLNRPESGSVVPDNSPRDKSPRDNFSQNSIRMAE